ncbi:hypothetical protein PIB30_090921 [Stylosanthes scabra]|uniref:Uncharacterized protein n=1 Tax=Stylosanthes scabra TaxID=79078 RepID=A0ABU6RUC0_9FABA|nr:hypothetical protein [Stylosanthes scabra]
MVHAKIAAKIKICLIERGVGKRLIGTGLRPQLRLRTLSWSLTGDRAEELFDKDIMGIFKHLRELLEHGDGPTRAIIKAQAKEIKRLKGVLGDHATIIGILWRRYTAGKERPLTFIEVYGSDEKHISSKSVASSDALGKGNGARI